jgi:tetratricopeptide (TPR) repeat protein
MIGCVRGPDRAAPQVALASLLSRRLNQGERAVELYRRALGDDPRNEGAVEALSVAASARGQWELLADLFDRRFNLAAGARRRTAIALEAGYVHLEQIGNHEAARVWFDRALELSSDEVTVLAAFVDLERTAGDDERLVRALDRLIRGSGQATPLRLLLEAAGLHTDRADHDQALSYLEMAQRQRPDDPLVLEALTTTYTNMLRYDDLASVLEQRAALAENDPETRASALLELGYVQSIQLGDSEAAQDAYERAFATRPDLPGIANTLEALYRKTESWEPLRNLLERATREGPQAERGGYQCSLGELLEERFDDHEQAYRCFEAALDVGPNPRALQGLTRLAERSGDPTTMVRALTREASQTADPSRVGEISLELCTRYESSDDLDAALSWAERALGTEPESRTFLEAVARLQERLGRDDDLTRTLTRLDEVLEGADQAAVRRRIAEFWEAKGDEDTALTWWEGSLESDPDDVASLEALRRHYSTRRRSEDLAPVLRKLADLAPQPEQAGYLNELCDVLDEQLCDLDGAIVVLWRLSDLPGRPDNVNTRLEALLERAGRFEELAQQLLESRRALPDGSEDSIEIELRRAQLLLDPLGQFEQAAEAFRAVRLHAPERAEATAGLERALRASDDPAGLARLLCEMAEQSDDPERRESLYFERAVLLDESLGELEQARQAYTALCTSDTSPGTATQAGIRLERLLERCGDWQALRVRLESTVLAAAPGAARELHERIASLCIDRMDDPEGCAEHLEAAGRLDPDRPDPWRKLASLYEDLRRQSDLLRVTEAELETGPDAERERVLHARAAALWVERPGEEDGANDHYERLLELEPGHADATRFLVERYEDLGRHADVVRLLEGRLAAILPDADTPADLDPNAGLQTSLRLRIGSLRADVLDDAVGAISVLEPALADGGPAGPAAEPLAELYERAGRRRELFELCEAAAHASNSASERVLWLMRLAQCLSEEGEDASAASAYREVLDERPDNEVAYGALCDLYRRDGQAAPLAELLEGALARTRGPEEIPIRMELARLLEERLARPSDALDHLQRVIELEGDHAAAFRHALKLAERLQRHDEQMQLLDTRLELHLSNDERIELLEMRGDLLAGVIDAADAAVAVYREVIALDPERRSARRSLREVLEGLGRWTAVLDCLYVDADGADAEERAAIYERAVELATAHVGQDAALPWLERLRSVRPDDPLVIARIADVHRLAGRFESVLRALEDEMALTTDLERKRDLHLGRARILERDMNAPGRAAAALEAARAVAPGDTDVLEKLDQLYAATGRNRDRAEVLEERIAGAGNSESLALHLAVASLYADQLADPDRAIPHLMRAVSSTRTLLGGVSEGPVTTPEDRCQLLAKLAATLRSAGREEAWARACEAELNVLRSDLGDHLPEGPEDVRVAHRNELHHKLAWTYKETLANPARALDHLRTLLELGGRALPAGLTDDEFDRIECACLGLLRQDENWVELEERLAARLDRATTSGPDEWLELARLRDERLHAPRAALDAYNRTLELRASSLPAMRGVRDLAERLGDWSEMARGLSLEITLPGWTPREKATLSRRLGEICWRRLDDRERAIDAFSAALESEPGDLESLRALEELHELQGEFSEAMARYEREAELLEQLGDTDRDRRKQVWLSVADIAGTHTEDSRRALRAFEAAAEISRLESDALRRRAELHRELGEDENFAAVYAEWCDDSDSRASCEEHLSLVDALVKLDRNADALERAQRAVEVNEQSADAWAAVAGLQQEQENATEAAEAWERAGELRIGTKAASHLLDAALLVEDRELENSARRLRRSVEMDPAYALAHAHLARVAEALESWEESERASARALDLAAAESGPPLDGSLQLDTAMVGGRAARAQDRLESAVLFFGVALELDEENREALEAYGELLFERGDLAAARGALEARLEMPDETDDDGRKAQRLAMLGSVLELADESAAALERFGRAVEVDPSCGAAHAGVARLCEKAGDTDQAVAALEGWAETARQEGDAAGCAARLLHAAEIELHQGRFDDSETHLRQSLEACADNARTWVLLTELLAEADQIDAVLELAAEALDQPSVSALPDAVARLSLLHARSLEQRDDPNAAAAAYGAAVQNDPRCGEAALARARLLRSVGQWQEAADCLREFCMDHPEPEHRDLAEAQYKLARLLSGPLEDMDGGIRCFERALEIAPDHPRARVPLAGLLAVMPERWNEAVIHHAAILDEDPTRSASIRALVTVARGRENREGALFGSSMLRAIGSASPAERTDAPGCLSRPLVSTPSLEDPIGEVARRLVQHASEALDQLLPPEDGTTADAFGRSLRESERELCAPRLDTLSDDELSDLLAMLAGLALGDEPGDMPRPETEFGRNLEEALERAVGRWTRRKMRRTLDGTSLGQIRAIDPSSWRAAVRGLAAAVAVDANQGDLRNALVHLCRDSEDASPIADSDDLSARIAGSGDAAELLRRVAANWSQQLVRG